MPQAATPRAPAKKARKKREPVLPCPLRTDEEWDLLATKHISLHLLAKERALFGAKWFDYRFTNPTKSTALFGCVYMDAHSAAMRLRIDDYHGQFERGLQPRDFEHLPAADRTGLWSGRQAADELGVPYDWFCGFAMRFAEEHGFYNMPRPAHLAIDDFKAAAREAWAEACLIRLRTASSGFFLACNYQDHPYQREYQRFLVGQAKSRKYPELALATLLVTNKALVRDFAEQEFGTALVGRAFSLAEKLSHN